jgi:hypothetical protein
MVKEFSKNIGEVNRSLGKSTEYMFNAKMWEKFNELGYTFTKGAPNVKLLAGRRTDNSGSRYVHGKRRGSSYRLV